MLYRNLRKLFCGILLTFLEVFDRASHVYETNGGDGKGQDIGLPGLVCEIVRLYFTEKPF